MHNEERVYPLSKQEKIASQHIGELICEACNRWHVIDEDAWEKMDGQSRENYVYLCPRDRCIRSRPDNLIDEKLIGKLYHPVAGEKDLYMFKLAGF